MKSECATWRNKAKWTNTDMQQLLNWEGIIGYIYLNGKTLNGNISHHGLLCENIFIFLTALFSLFSDNLCVTNSHMLFLPVKSSAMKQQDNN